MHVKEDANTVSYVLQHIILQDVPVLNKSDELYFKGHYHVDRSGDRVAIRMNPDDAINTHAFYNAFSLTKWAKYCNLGRLSVSLTGSGTVFVEAFLCNTAISRKSLAAKTIRLDGDERLDIDVAGCSKGLIVLRIVAITRALIYGGGFCTDSAPTRAVRLGVVLTHFNRIASASRVVREFKRGLPVMGKDISLVIVDNSRNFPADLGDDQVEVIPNDNYGGSGGYARGLLHLSRHGYTHAIFMDDDVASNMECVYRIFMIFSYAQVDIAISGAIIDADDGVTVLQAGGNYRYGKSWEPALGGVDVASEEGLLHFNKWDRTIMFGAFPFYAFPLLGDGRQNYPFPFFVRGDDVLFGLQNHYVRKIIWPGIGVSLSRASLVMNENPSTLYQDTRALLTIELSEQSRSGLMKIIRMYSRLLLIQLFSYKYASVAAVRAALTDVMKGPGFFSANMDNAEIRARNRGLNEQEHFGEWDDSAEIDECYRPCRPKVLRALTLNGLLLPTFLMRRKGILHPQGRRAVFRRTYGYRYVVYESADGQYLVARHCKKKIASGLVHWLADILLILFRFKKLRVIYSDIGNMTTAEFWEKIYG